jgi:formylglycine-generating enzyme
VLLGLLDVGCPASRQADPGPGAAAAALGPRSGPSETSSDAEPRVNEGAEEAATQAEAREPAPPLPDDAVPLLHATTEELLSLVPVPHPIADTEAGLSHPELLLQSLVGPTPGRFNQGNPALARHDLTRRACLEGLRGLVLQTDAQRRTCHGMENMVPIYLGGIVAAAKTCIDIFEFPNRACELPMVWGTPSGAQKICALEGKRLCTENEWNLACKGDPEGKSDWTYAYGDELDLSLCNTNRPHATLSNGHWICNALSAQTAWATCATETEPAGGFPRCRSRFGVFDQHGNVAEMMTRLDADGVVTTQLKGSAFFYVDVARKPNEAQKPGARETYPDHCAYDPRWHVEALEGAVHSNYHLGFRCCLPL